MSEKEVSGGNTGRIITIAVVALLAAALGFFIYKYYTEKSKNDIQEITVDELTTEIEDLEVDLEEYQTDLESKDMEIEDKERILAEKEQELIEKQKRIDQLLKSKKISQAEAGKLQGKVDQLEFYIKRYQKEIDELKKKVAALEGENSKLVQKIDTISGKYIQLKDKNIAAENKLKAASILKAFNFRFFRFRGKDKAIEDEDFRRGQMDKIQIRFTILENPAASAGTKDVYIQIQDPSGKVITDINKQSGYFNSMGDDLPYSVKKTIEYDKINTPVSVNFLEPENYDYEKGEHRVIVYCDGTDIAESKFTVK